MASSTRRTSLTALTPPTWCRWEYRHLNVKTLMTQPYARIMVMHLTLIVGGFVTIAAGEGKALCAILVLIKTAADARQHRRERRAGAGDPLPAAA